MRDRFLAYLAAMLLLGAPFAEAMGPSWETLATAQPELSAGSVDAEVRDGYIYVTTTQPLDVKVFSIVGQLIAQQRLPAGTSRLKVAKRGIYILKAGDRTFRVTI